EGHAAVRHQRQPLAVGRMDGIDHIRARDLRANLFRQVGDLHGPDIDDAVAALGQGVEGRVHLPPPFPMRMVWTTVSGTFRHRSMFSRPCSMLAPATSTPSARTKLRWKARAAMPR